jgi:predicted DNA-binding ribbon-helix-helix protein
LAAKKGASAFWLSDRGPTLGDPAEQGMPTGSKGLLSRHNIPRTVCRYRCRQTLADWLPIFRRWKGRAWVPHWNFFSCHKLRRHSGLRLPPGHMGRRALQASGIRKHSIVLAGRKTSVSLEEEFWKSLRAIAWGRRETLSDLLAKIDADRQSANLSSAIRMFVLRCYRDELDRRGGAVTSLGTPSNPIEQTPSDFKRS